MQLALPFAEAIAFAEVQEPLPPMVRDLRCEGSTIHADVDLRAIPDPSTGLRLAAAAAGAVAVTVRFADYSDGTATLVVTAHARAFPRTSRAVPRRPDQRGRCGTAACRRAWWRSSGASRSHGSRSRCSGRSRPRWRA